MLAAVHTVVEVKEVAAGADQRLLGVHWSRVVTRVLQTPRNVLNHPASRTRLTRRRDSGHCLHHTGNALIALAVHVVHWLW